MKIEKYRLRFRLSLTLALTLALSSTCFAHPGRLDKNGCHEVKEAQRKAGEPGYHCHRGLGKMKLGEDVLEQSKTKTPAKTKSKAGTK